MTATAELVNSETPAAMPVRMADGGRMMIRATQRLFGAALALAALGLWFAPGASWESDVMLFKLILSVTAGLAGLGLMQSSSTPKAPQIEVDTIRREVRLVRPDRDGAKTVLQRCAFSDLTRAERDGLHMRLWDHSGTFLAEVTLSDPAAMMSLVAGLQDAGKLD